MRLKTKVFATQMVNPCRIPATLERVIAVFHFLSSLNRLRRKFVFGTKRFKFEPFLDDFKVGCVFDIE